MNIEDFLKTEQFKELDEFLNEEMKKYAENELLEKMDFVFGDSEKSRNWFYTSLIALGGKRSYDYCKEGKSSYIEDVLGRIEHGIIQ